MGIILIDLGLSQSSASVEDRAVDIYVFERAIQSTHPQDQGEWIFDAMVMKGYTHAMDKYIGQQKTQEILHKLHQGISLSLSLSV